MDEILKAGEKVHIIERRYFENDPRRHFVGEIIKSTRNVIRTKGYVWILNTSRNEFSRKPELRERVIVIGERLIVNVIPKEVNLEDINYVDKESGGLVVTDEKTFELDINEFSATR